MRIETKYKYIKVFLNLNSVIPNRGKFFSREEFNCCTEGNIID